MKVLFDTKKIQKMGRIALNDVLLKNAGLREGDLVDVYFDVDNKHIIIQPIGPSSAETESVKGTVPKRTRK